MLQKGDKLTAERLNGLIKTRPGKGMATANRAGYVNLSALRQPNGATPPTMVDAILVDDEANTTFIPPFTPVAIVGILGSDIQGILNPVLQIRLPTADDIAEGAALGVVQQGISIETISDASDPSADKNAFGMMAKVAVDGTTVVRVTREASSSGKQLNYTEGTDAASFSAGPLLILAEEGEPEPESSTHFALAVFQTTSSESALRYLEILGGNVMMPGSIAGIKKVSTVISSSATERDPGTRATANAPTISAGVITAVTLGIAGTGYEDGTRVCYVTGDGVGAAITATVSGGVVTGFNISNGGTGYTTAVVTIRPPNGDAPGIPWEDGLGYGNLVDPQDPNNYTRVLIVNDARSPLEDAITQNTNRANPSIRGTVTIDHDDAATISTAYIPWAV